MNTNYYWRNSPSTESELLETLVYFGKNTKRKQVIAIKKDIKELQERVDDISTRLGSKDFVWLHGERYDIVSLLLLEDDLKVHKHFLETIQ